ncbi:hypothetical protein ACROYT_G031436 [Oculina patagonica]
MGHLCQFCQRSFSRRYNRDRHEKQNCHKRLDQEQEEMTSFAREEIDEDEHGNNLSQDDEEPEEEYHEVDDDIDGKSENEDGDEEEEEDHSDEDNESTTANDENDDIDPWDKLREESIIDLKSSLVEQVEQYLTQGLSKEDAKFQASTLLLPAYRKRLRLLYLHYLKWYRVLKTDPTHKKVMTTLRSFMEDDEMDFAEAAEAAINKRKYLLNRLFQYNDVCKENLSESDDEEIRYQRSGEEQSGAESRAEQSGAEQRSIAQHLRRAEQSRAELSRAESQSREEEIGEQSKTEQSC